MSETSTFLTAAELQAALAGMNPSALKDVGLIEQGTTAALTMTRSIRSLKGPEHLFSSPEDLRLLVQRNIVNEYVWLDYQVDSGRLSTRKVFIRPASLRTSDADRIVQDCDEMSALSLACYLHHREKVGFLAETPTAVFRGLLDRHRLIEALGTLESHTMEGLLESYDLPDRTIGRVMQILNRPCSELFLHFQSSREIPPGVLEAVENRGEQVFLYAIAPERHILFPDPALLIQPGDDDLVEQPTYAEWLYQAHLETARSLALQVESSAEGFDYETLRALFDQHASLRSDDAWPGIQSFHDALRRLHDLVEILRQMRLEAALDFAYTDMLSVLNMQLRPVSITAETLTPPPFLLKRLADPLRIFKQFLERAKKDPEVLVHQGSRGEHFFLFRSNLIQAFIDHRSQRTLLHLMAKQNGIPGGIYDFVAQSAGLTEAARRLQEELLLAIRRWEDDRKREIAKSERAKKSIFQRLIDWVLTVLGLMPPAPVNDESTVPEATPATTASRRKRPSAPAERRKTLPSRVEQAVSFVERKFDGLIWVDDVVEALASPNMNADAVSDMLFYDREQRFKEIRALSKLRRLYIRMESLENPEWMKKTIQALETTSRMPHHLALLDYLKKDED
ncbi:MAG: hypothetical protein F9K24_07715 [Leptonema illini]|uniref:Uncharacterized protein n=1 Tax=Leptonema illini TaxID=183 RepID=A0A833H2V7_9LEPT|nr:MAG: hypothetical protein F9K24_07715 [Leptonema illini]